MRERIKFLRRSLNMTQYEFAQKLGITNATISDIERGKIKNLSIRNVKLISDTFGISQVWLREGVGEMIPGKEGGLDSIAINNGLSDLEREIIALYMKQPQKVRQRLLKDLISALPVHEEEEEYSEEVSILDKFDFFDKRTGEKYMPSMKEVNAVLDIAAKKNMLQKDKLS